MCAIIGMKVRMQSLLEMTPLAVFISQPHGCLPAMAWPLGIGPNELQKFEFARHCKQVPLALSFDEG
jgi:hypothetical protein